MLHSFLEAVSAKQRTQAADQPNVHGFREGVFALSVSAGGANALTRPTGGTHYRVPWTL